MSNELKPCPFCGGSVKLEQTIDGRKWWGVVCRNTINLGGTCAIQQVPSASPESAIERWNCRAAPSVASGAQEIDLGEDLPPLPDAIEVGGEGWGFEDFQSEKTFTADHMTAYARAAIAAQAKPVEMTDEQIHAMWRKLCAGGKGFGKGVGVKHIVRAVESSILANSAPNKALTESHISKIARYLSDFSSGQCGVNKDDAWKIYGDDEIALVRAALNAAGVEVK